MFSNIGVENHENFIEKHNINKCINLHSYNYVFAEEEVRNAIDIYIEAMEEYMFYISDPEEGRAGDSRGAMKHAERRRRR